MTEYIKKRFATIPHLETTKAWKFYEENWEFKIHENRLNYSDYRDLFNQIFDGFVTEILMADPTDVVYYRDRLETPW